MLTVCPGHPGFTQICSPGLLEAVWDTQKSKTGETASWGATLALEGILLPVEELWQEGRG